MPLPPVDTRKLLGWRSYTLSRSWIRSSQFAKVRSASRWQRRANLRLAVERQHLLKLIDVQSAQVYLVLFEHSDREGNARLVEQRLKL
jgi:hypothetical protein